ncbi:Cytochrome C553 soluble cytochrome f (chromatophore) [Paulinella micropora]|uniref:Cytochrome C n=1 Tax=Paulinella micropora TaxID=1928728 RepID=A0A1L5YAT1_9EUKA|nr:cytochrome C [Paulinella micropora]AQX44583.1 cytochrome C [Paulinella micropora]BBL86662.1 Cytochrome C553 soluble cytochrome f [Paulinella micropora]
MKELLSGFFDVLKRILLVVSILSFALPALSLDDNGDQSTGSRLFTKHCVGCHLNGKNIIRRSKTLSKSDLYRQGILDVQAIATIARAGIGQMSGYEDELSFEEAQEISQWIYLQALNSWHQE